VTDERSPGDDRSPAVGAGPRDSPSDEQIQALAEQLRDETSEEDVRVDVAEASEHIGTGTDR
jgi:hypothetical protein